jgi:hypothetical protein
LTYVTFGVIARIEEDLRLLRPRDKAEAARTAAVPGKGARKPKKMNL